MPAISLSRRRIGLSGTGASRFGQRSGRIRLFIGLREVLLLRVPTHAFEVHHGDVVVFGVTAYTTFAGAVVDVARIADELIQGIAAVIFGGVDDGHQRLSSSLMMRTS